MRKLHSCVDPIQLGKETVRCGGRRGRGGGGDVGGVVVFDPCCLFETLLGYALLCKSIRRQQTREGAIEAEDLSCIKLCVYFRFWTRAKRLALCEV